MVKSETVPPPSKSVAAFVPPPFARRPLRDVLDLMTRCNRPPLFASPSAANLGSSRDPGVAGQNRTNGN